MHEKPLLLPSAKVAILVPPNSSRRARVARLALIAVGLLCVVWGAADLTTRAARVALGEDAAFVAFAPAAALGQDPLASSSVAGAIVPARLTIPALGVDAAVEHVGVKVDGSMDTPKSFDDVAWYSLGGKPGGAGSAVFAGHVNNGLGLSGVFADLSLIKKGDYITVADSAKHTKVYRVISVETYNKGASTEALFSTAGPSQLVLITCDGAWVPAQRTYDRRLVVIATPAY